MSRRRIPKLLSEELRSLDDHLMLLRDALDKLRAVDSAYLKIVAAELRVLVCASSGTEGLLWRLLTRTKVSDEVHVLCSWTFPDHLGLSWVDENGLQVSYNRRMPREFQPCSFLSIVKNGYAVYFEGQPITYEALIKAVAQQIGTAHEDPSIEPMLAALSIRSENSNSLTIYTVIDFVADLALEVGERVIEFAEAELNYRRPPRPGLGDVSLYVSIAPRLLPNFPMEFIFDSEVADVEFKFIWSSQGSRCDILKRGNLFRSIDVLQDPSNSTPLTFVFQYSSNRKTMRFINTFSQERETSSCDLGWLDERELQRCTKIKMKRFPEQRCLLASGVLGRLIAPAEALSVPFENSVSRIIVGSYPARVRSLILDPSRPFVDQFFEVMHDDEQDLGSFPE